MTSSPPTLLSSAFPYSPTIDDDTIHSRLEESERSRDWWKQRASVLDLRCREINAELRDTLAENKKYPIPLNRYLYFCRLKQENERLATELHLFRMRKIAEQTLRKIDSKNTIHHLPSTPPLTPTTTPMTSPFIPHHPLPSPPSTPPRPTSSRLRSPSRMTSRSLLQ